MATALEVNKKMGELVNELAAVVGARRERLPQVRDEIARWRRADVAVAGLHEAVIQLRDHHVTPPDIAGQLDQLRTGTLRLSITRAIERFQRLEARLERGTVCIGVAGASRTGKSTLLQSISGLTDVQLPTGAASAVTAVPSRICHTPGRRRAILALHSFETFRRSQLAPRYLRAGLGEPPADVDAFRAAVYADANHEGSAEALRELRAVQAALWSYEGLLDRPDRTLELSGDELDRLPEYVAFPDSAIRADGAAGRRHLAVRDVRIECPFPRAEHGAIELVDLPGADTATMGVDSGLMYEMDVLLVIRRTTDPASNLEDVAMPYPSDGPVVRRRDLVLLVHNGTSHRAGQASPRVLEVNGKEPNDVSARLLTPVLRYLGAQLPALDDDLYARTRVRTRPIWEGLVGLAAETKAVLAQVPRMTRTTANELYQRVDILSAGLSNALCGVLADLRARAAADQAHFRDIVSSTRDELLDWASGGLGIGRERWCAEALRRMVRDRASHPFAAAQLTRTRVEINRRHAAALDPYLGRLLQRTWTDVADTLRGQLNTLPPDQSGAAALGQLADLAARAGDPGVAITTAISDLLAVRLDYRTQLDPRLWFDADPLVDPVPEVPATAEGAECLHQIISARAEKAAVQAHLHLLEEADLPGKVLSTAITRFADALFASEAAQREIRQLARGYRVDLWPDMSPGLDDADARVALVAQAADHLLAATTEWEEPIG